jgi:hypothetical protein
VHRFAVRWRLKGDIIVACWTKVMFTGNPLFDRGISEAVASGRSDTFSQESGREVVMKQPAFLALLAMAAVLSSCGSNHIQKLPTSNWQAQLTGGIGPAAALNFQVNFNLSVTNGSFGQNANISDFSFTRGYPCFSGVPSVVGSVNVTNTLNTNQINGSIVLTVRSGTGNILTLSAVPPTGELIANSNNGVLTNGVVKGSWWLTPGSSSSDTGCVAGSAASPLPFSMCQNATSCNAAVEPSVLPSQF